MTKNMDFIKKLLKGSTSMPVGTAMGAGSPMAGHGHHHHHDGCCGHDHSSDHHGHDHAHDHHDHDHKDDGSCCGHDHK